MGAQNVKFAPNLHQNGRIPALNFVFVKENFLTKNFFDRLKFRGWQLPPPQFPCHNHTVNNNRL